MTKTPARSAQMLSVGEVATRSGMRISALHFYEREGLIRSMRSGGNQRRYPRGVLRALAIIKVAQRAGVPLAQVRVAFDLLPSGRPPSADEWAQMSRGWQADLDARITRLSALRDQLSKCIGCGCLSLGDCPLRNPDDMLSKLGTGPRLLDPDD